MVSHVLKHWWLINHFSNVDPCVVWYNWVSQIRLLFELIIRQLETLLSHPEWVCGLKSWYPWLFGWRRGRTLSGCVGWNTKVPLLPLKLIVAPRVGVWVEILVVPSKSILMIVSHPEWVCGLKCTQMTKEYIGLGRTLSGCAGWNQQVEALHQTACVAPREGEWIEIVMDSSVTETNPSHPEWVCGLKFSSVMSKGAYDKVAPRVGAWVEI